MRYNEENQTGLMSLLSGLEAGMDPTTAYGMYQDIRSNQEQQNAMRMERQQGLIGLLQELAMNGTPYAGAQAMAEAAPGPMGPAIDTALSSLYGDSQPMTQTPYGAPEPAGTAPLPETLSPAYVPPQPPPVEAMSPLEQLQYGQAQMELENQAQLDSAGQASALAGLEAALRTGKEQGKTLGEIMTDVIAASPENAMYLQRDPAAVRAVMARVFEPEEITTTPWHAQIGVPQ